MNTSQPILTDEWSKKTPNLAIRRFSGALLPQFYAVFPWWGFRGNSLCRGSRGNSSWQLPVVPSWWAFRGSSPWFPRGGLSVVGFPWWAFRGASVVPWWRVSVTAPFCPLPFCPLPLRPSPSAALSLCGPLPPRPPPSGMPASAAYWAAGVAAGVSVIPSSFFTSGAISVRAASSK